VRCLRELRQNRTRCETGSRPRAIRGHGTENWVAGLPFEATKIGNQQVLPVSCAKRVSMRNRRGKAMPLLGAAGLLALASGASAETSGRANY
jgi:hypothetical protein